MFVYNFRILDRYDREVISLAIRADNDPGWRPNHYEYGRWGSRIRMEFPIVKLLDYAPHWQVRETNPNPFAVVVLAHSKTLETQNAPAQRQAWKWRLVKGLFERGLTPDTVRHLFLFIDWLMDLPPAREKLCWQEVEHYQQEHRLPNMLQIERIILTEELLAGIELGLDLKFGKEGLQLMSEISQLTDIEQLRAVRQAIKTAANPEELRRVWAPQRRPKKGRRR